jgi:hypothetical protein
LFQRKLHYDISQLRAKIAGVERKEAKIKKEIVKIESSRNGGALGQKRSGSKNGTEESSKRSNGH